MGVRSFEKGRAAAEKLQVVAPSAKIEVWQLDMESYDSIQAFARKCQTNLTRIDAVILNAGLAPFVFEKTAATGHEKAIQVNHISTALLTILLIPVLKTKVTGQGPPRLTIVNSLTAHLCSFPNKDERPLLASFDDTMITPWSGQERYGVSKLLNQLFIVKLTEKVDSNEVIVNMVDPGLTKGTGLPQHATGAVAVAAKVFNTIAGRPLNRGAATYVDAVFGHGKESHGCFLMNCQISPLACWFYTDGEVLSEQVWNETLKELSFAGVQDIIAKISQTGVCRRRAITEAQSKKPKARQKAMFLEAGLLEKERPGVKSWILKRDAQKEVEIQHGSIPPRVGSDFSLLDFPEPLQPYMKQDLVRSFYGMKGALYPSEICLQVDATQSSWTTNLLVDLVYFHSAIFSIEAYFDQYFGRDQGTLSHFHFLKTLRLLQERLNDPGNPASISDATIMVVITLGLTAELIGDRSAAENHLAGMARIVDLRGGLEMLRFDNARLPAKVCRVDLGLVLRFGCKPVFFNETMSWDPYISSQGLIRGLKKVNILETEATVFIKTLDKRLANVWKDLQEFAMLGNIAHQTSRKLQPNTFSEIMVSILYRLLALSFPESPIEDALRVGMIAFTAAMFFRWRSMNQRQQYLDDTFRETLSKLKDASAQPPLSVLFWLLMVWTITVSQNSEQNVFSKWMDDILQDLGLSSWSDAQKTLKSVLWVGCLFDDPGQQAFDIILSKK
ncbi:hypothetical protein CEP52_006360 [Fusarium oligoseptatum]|uniref:Uncharacterized protein n=1 Tax=Fusarium oligoseptatum TaxID=2604345 RepID=A0A428TTH5_9HYPO|nr:hypothetical protein CEP52_006360 [Fusarium oligoseptatum]